MTGKENFEEKAAAAIRTLTVWCAVLAVGLLAVLGVAVWGFTRASNDQSGLQAVVQEVQASVKSPSHVRNIAIWCGFDQAMKADLLAYIAQFHGHAPPLKLPHLDCAQIEQGVPTGGK